MSDIVRVAEEKQNILNMPWEDLRRILRTLGPEIRQLAERGDALATRVYNLYCECAYKNLPLEHQTHKSLRAALTEYMFRDTSISDRKEMGSKFGHLVDEEKGERPTQIVVPPGVRKQ